MRKVNNEKSWKKLTVYKFFRQSQECPRNCTNRNVFLRTVNDLCKLVKNNSKSKVNFNRRKLMSENMELYQNFEM